MRLQLPKAFKLLKKTCLSQAFRSSLEDGGQVLTQMLQVDFLSRNIKHEFCVIVEALFDLVVVDRLVPDPVDERIDKGEVGLIVIFFFVGDVWWFDNFHLADVNLARKIMARLVLEEHGVRNSGDEARLCLEWL